MILAYGIVFTSEQIYITIQDVVLFCFLILINTSASFKQNFRNSLRSKKICSSLHNLYFK